MRNVIAVVVALLVSGSAFAEEGCPMDKIQHDTLVTQQILQNQLKPSCTLKEADKLADFYVGFSKKMDNCPESLRDAKKPLLADLQKRVEQMTENCQ